MKKADMIRMLQKTGEFHFENCTRERSRKLADDLAQEAMAEDRRWGVESQFGVARDVFGYYFVTQIN